MKYEITEARKLLKTLTPLKTDCGAYCGGACCASDSEEEQGMLLLPGEEELYAECEWADVMAAKFAGIDDARMLVCGGKCPRDERPLACRLFPIAPRKGETGYTARVDRRSFAVCPLAGYGLQAFDRAFVEACERAFETLAQDGSCRDYLDAWSALMDEYERGL